MEEGGTEKSIDSGAAEKCEGFYEDGSGVRRYIDADTSQKTTTTTGKVNGIYSGKMEMVAAGGYAAEMQGYEGWGRVAKVGIDNGMTER